MSEVETNGNGAAQPEEESKFVKLLNRSVAKVKDMKHVDGKYALENIIFPLFSAFYREFDDEMENVLSKIDIDDDLAAAIEDSPEFIQEMVKYVSWVGNTVDAIYRMAGFIAVDEKDPTKANFTTRATEEAKKLYLEVGKRNLDVLQKVKDVEDQLGDDDGPDDGDGEDGEDGGLLEVPVNTQLTPVAPVAPVAPMVVAPPEESKTEPVKV